VLGFRVLAAFGAISMWVPHYSDLAQPVSAEDRIAKNTEYAKKLIEKGVNHGREVATITAKAGTDAAEILHRRATEGLDEFRSLANQQAAR